MDKYIVLTRDWKGYYHFDETTRWMKVFAGENEIDTRGSDSYAIVLTSIENPKLTPQEVFEMVVGDAEILEGYSLIEKFFKEGITCNPA